MPIRMQHHMAPRAPGRRNSGDANAHPGLTEGNDMKTTFIVSAAICALALAGCNQSPAENLADRVENAADARADAMENQAEALQDRAEQVRETGEERADAITAADRNVAATMTEERRDAVVANEAPAVR